MKDLTQAQQQHLLPRGGTSGFERAFDRRECLSQIRALAVRGLVTLTHAPEGGLACRLAVSKPTIEVTEYTRTRWGLDVP